MGARPWPLLLLLLSGCSVDPVDRALDAMYREDLAAKREALRVLGRSEDETRALPVLLESLEEADLRDEAGRQLVLWGRRWEAHNKASDLKHNPVLAEVGALAARADPEVEVRCKAVWVLGEVGARSARKSIEAAYAGDSARVAAVQVKALQKLGFDAKARRRELLG